VRNLDRSVDPSDVETAITTADAHAAGTKANRPAFGRAVFLSDR
jgi:hypothetical protein